MEENLLLKLQTGNLNGSFSKILTNVFSKKCQHLLLRCNLCFVTGFWTSCFFVRCTFIRKFFLEFFGFFFQSSNDPLLVLSLFFQVRFRSPFLILKKGNDFIFGRVPLIFSLFLHYFSLFWFFAHLFAFIFSSCFFRLLFVLGFNLHHLALPRIVYYHISFYSIQLYPTKLRFTFHLTFHTPPFRQPLFAIFLYSILYIGNIVSNKI